MVKVNIKSNPVQWCNYWKNNDVYSMTLITHRKAVKCNNLIDYRKVCVEASQRCYSICADSMRCRRSTSVAFWQRRRGGGFSISHTLSTPNQSKIDTLYNPNGGYHSNTTWDLFASSCKLQLARHLFPVCLVCCVCFYTVFDNSSELVLRLLLLFCYMQNLSKFNTE